MQSVKKNFTIILSLLFISLSLFLPVVTFAQEQPAEFKLWLYEFKLDAVAAGISQATLDGALQKVIPLAWVVKADRNQPEFKKTLDQYLNAVLSFKRIRTGRQRFAENAELLQQVSDKYAVQPQFIVALWGIETYYGRNTGKVPIIDALVTLAYDGRRSKYFRKELINALKIIDAGHISYGQMKGSWAGAMGQVQFMPSSFLRYAVDGNGDGRIDLWETPEDYFSSAANYLAQMGWKVTESWGMEVALPKNTEFSKSSDGKQRSMFAWQKLGVRDRNGNKLPTLNIQATLLQPEGESGAAFLVYGNYQAILKWNRAHSFALAVGMLADQVGAENRGYR